MSRRRRRDGEEERDALSENEEADENRSASVASESDIEDELDVSDYESLEEEVRNSSEDELEDDPPPPVADNKEPEQPATRTKIILERKQEDEILPPVQSEEPDSETDPGHENENVVPDNPERGSGDGKEESDSDFNKNESKQQVKDEDDKDDDPAFIPTKGAFFQHDVRSDSQSNGRGRDRKLWDKGPAKWSHDMFIMEDQMPKSRDILIHNYGYDIRELPVDAPPPSGRSRNRGRGRGGYRGRVRQSRTQNYPRERQRPNKDEESSDYIDEYPLPGKGGDYSQRHIKTKSFYNTQRHGKVKENKSHDSKHVSHSTSKTKRDTTENGTSGSSSASHPPDDKRDEKFSDILQVIHDRENAPPSEETVSSTTTPPTSRKGDRPTRGRQNTTYSRYHEAPKPRRYSSLRQKQSDGTSSSQNPSMPPRNRDQKYATFSKPIQPSSSLSSNFSNQPAATNSRLEADRIGNSSHQKVSASISEQTQPYTHTQSPVTVPPMQQNVQTSVPPTHVNAPSMPFPDLNQAAMAARADPSVAPMPQMLAMYNPMLNPSYLDAAAGYQQMLRMMSQMSMDQLQQIPPAMAAPITAGAARIPPDPQVLPHPGEMQLNSMAPPVSQAMSPGSLGSVMRPPHPPMNPPTYFTGPMNFNMLQRQQQQPQAPLAFPPNLVTQQVGGVTYFNTANPSPPVPPVNNQASPRRNAAIPIMAPGAFAGPAGLE